MLQRQCTSGFFLEVGSGSQFSEALVLRGRPRCCKAGSDMPREAHQTRKHGDVFRFWDCSSSSTISSGFQCRQVASLLWMATGKSQLGETVHFCADGFQYRMGPWQVFDPPGNVFTEAGKTKDGLRNQSLQYDCWYLVQVGRWLLDT